MCIWCVALISPRCNGIAVSVKRIRTAKSPDYRYSEDFSDVKTGALVANFCRFVQDWALANHDAALPWGFLDSWENSLFLALKTTLLSLCGWSEEDRRLALSPEIEKYQIWPAGVTLRPPSSLPGSQGVLLWQNFATFFQLWPPLKVWRTPLPPPSVWNVTYQWETWW